LTPRVYVGNTATFPVGNLLQKGQPSFSNIYQLFPESRCLFFYSARYALAAILQSLALGSKDKVLLPSYNCGVEIYPFQYFGVEIEFYRVTTSIQIDIDDIISKIDKHTKVILVTHYFGFPQEISELKTVCRENDIFLIEDCAHAFLSKSNGLYLGTIGDAAIFSLRKTLPIPDGGLLLTNNPNLVLDVHQTEPYLFPTLYMAAQILARKSYDSIDSRTIMTRIAFKSISQILELARLTLRLLRKLTNMCKLNLVYNDAYRYQPEVNSWGISALSTKVIDKIDFTSIKNKRNENYNYVSQQLRDLEGIELLFEKSTDNICPLLLPIIVQNRDLCYSSMKKKGVVTHPYWSWFHPDVPWKRFPEAVFLKTNVLGFPIHQDLTRCNLDYIVKVFKQILKEKTT